MTNEEKQKRRDEVEDVLSCFAVIVFMFAMYLAVIVFGPTPAPSRAEPASPLPSPKKGGSHDTLNSKSNVYTPTLLHSCTP